MIFTLLWRHLPGPRPVRLVVILLIIAALIVFAFTVGFPWLVENVIPEPGASVSNDTAP